MVVLVLDFEEADSGGGIAACAYFLPHQFSPSVLGVGREGGCVEIDAVIVLNAFAALLKHHIAAVQCLAQQSCKSGLGREVFGVDAVHKAYAVHLGKAYGSETVHKPLQRSKSRPIHCPPQPNTQTICSVSVCL